MNHKRGLFDLKQVKIITKIAKTVYNVYLIEYNMGGKGDDLYVYSSYSDSY